jgi:hypothetical protein
MKENYLEIIRELNEALWEENGVDTLYFSYSTEGNIDVIEFMDVHLWDSENDERTFNEETNNYEPLLPYIKAKFNQYADLIYKLKYNI